MPWAISQKSAEFLIRSRLADAEARRCRCLVRARRDLFDRTRGRAVDLIEAHKWFNLAALSGCTRGQQCRAEIALEMTAREIAEAQRQARAWLDSGRTRRGSRSPWPPPGSAARRCRRGWRRAP
jgi:hypothetical protein